MYRLPRSEISKVDASEERIPEMTLEESTRLDNYGHRELVTLTEEQLRDYAYLLETRRNEILEPLQKLQKKLCLIRRGG